MKLSLYAQYYADLYPAIASHLPYIICIAIICVGLYVVTNSSNYFKKLVGLGVVQSGAILFFISIAKVQNGRIPIINCLSLECNTNLFTNPLPHVLMLTAIVVGLATLAVGLALIVKIKEEYGTIEEMELNEIDDKIS